MSENHYEISGFLNINKPTGMSSFDVIRVLRKNIGRLKMGHAGTLDPLASGVLTVAIGKATKLISSLPKEKEYKAEILLGKSTTTDDREGEIVDQHDASAISFDEVKALIQNHFTGQIEQRPPIFSAIHIDGKRLYKLARSDNAPQLEEIPLRTVEITQFTCSEFIPGSEALLTCVIACSTGTYIRSLARDIGKQLGVGGHLQSLERILSGGFRLEDSVQLEEVNSGNLGNYLRQKPSEIIQSPNGQ
ncbi:MAG: tRNA pseudouridine(55) synthase TruB [bacterium]